LEAFFGDLRKAFGCVDHDLLLSKMLWYGISGKRYNPIQSYLKNRYQKVIIANKSRKYENMKNAYWSSHKVTVILARF